MNRTLVVFRLLAAARELAVTLRTTVHTILALPAIMKSVRTAMVAGRPEVEKEYAIAPSCNRA